jgi:hypothetical protein
VQEVKTLGSWGDLSTTIESGAWDLSCERDISKVVSDLPD